MPIKVEIPLSLRRFTDGQADTSLPGHTVGEVLSALGQRFPELTEYLYDEGGDLQNFLNVYLNSEDTRHLAGENTPTNVGDTIMIIVAVAGG
jgi:molybdopterin synthase sulfur carrier subunit